MADYPRFPHDLDGDDVSQQELVNRGDILDDEVYAVQMASLQHYQDPEAHPQINTRFTSANHATDEARHVGTNEVVAPTPPAGGPFILQSQNGVLSWVPFQ